MAKRVWEYNVLATLEHNCPVYSFVIYLTPSTKIPDSPLVWGLPGYETVHIFRFKNIKLWELPVEALKDKGLVELLPLCLLTQGGAQQKIAEDVFDNLVGEKELLALALTFASMVFEAEADQQWLRRRIAMLEDIVRETWFYKDIYQEGREEGKEEGKEEGMLQALRVAMLDIVQERFPEIVDIAKRQVDGIQDLAILRRVIVKMSAAQAVEEAERYLREIGRDGES